MSKSKTSWKIVIIVFSYLILVKNKLNPSKKIVLVIEDLCESNDFIEKYLQFEELFRHKN